MSSRCVNVPLVIPFSDPSAADPKVSGGKGASLRRMHAAGLQVPPGIVITTDGLKASLEQLGIEAALSAVLEDLADGVNTPAVTYEALRELLDGLYPPEMVADALRTEITRTNGLCAPYAVRSSAVFEDGLDRSWAGQFATLLRVADEDLLDSVRACWLSAFSRTALSYDPRAYRDFGFAVVVQRMIEPDAAGVAFSYDPTDSTRDRALVEATPGSGERLVGGGEVPLTLYLRRTDGMVLRRRVEHPRFEAVLVPSQLKRLWEAMRQVEEIYEGGVDLEWAFIGEELHLLQARPITALSALETTSEIRDGKPDPAQYELTFKVGGLPFLMADILAVGFGYLDPFFVSAHSEFRQYFPNRVMEWAATEGYRWLRLEEGFKLYRDEFEEFYAANRDQARRLLAEPLLSSGTLELLIDHCAEVMRRYSRMDFQFTNLVAAYSSHDPIIARNLENLASFKDEAREWVNQTLINDDSTFSQVVGKLADALPIEAQTVLNLTRDELLSLLTGRLEADKLMERASERDTAYAIFKGAEGTEYLRGQPAEQLFREVSQLEERLTSAPLSGHVANTAGRSSLQGKVYVLPVDYSGSEDLALEIESMPRGAILVAEFTAPELMQACEKAKGIITDLGGMLSHASIVSRELGLPCVVGTRVGSRVLRTGDVIEVDLTNGSIRRRAS